MLCLHDKIDYFILFQLFSIYIGIYTNKNIVIQHTQIGRHLRTAESHPAVWRETDSGGSEQGKQGISWWSRRDRDFSRRVSLRHLSTPEKERMEERIVSVPLPLLMAVSTTAQKRADISNPCENVSKNKVPTGPRNQTQL